LSIELTSYTASFVDELARSGIVNVVISPGSRSTPLAYLFTEHPKFKVWVDIDERSAAFFALGMAKTDGNPAVLLCTSGTAAANYLPAVTEARISRVPLIVLTADRPHELRDVGAPQAIDQLDLYSKHAKWFFDMPLPEGSEAMQRFVRETANRVVATAVSEPAGVVHLNFPFREPLIPDFSLAQQFFSTDHPTVAVYQGSVRLETNVLYKLADRLNSVDRGIIVCGQVDHISFEEDLFEIASKCGFPILADPLSQLRTCFAKHQQFLIDCYDSFLRFDEITQALQPELIIRIGAMPVSKALTQFIQNSSAEQIVIDGGNGWREPTGTATTMVYCDEAKFCHDLNKWIEDKGTSTYVKKWTDVNRWITKILGKVKDSGYLQEGQIFSKIADWLPDECNLFAGNSMVIRNLDTHFHHTNKQIRIFGNRGANGIDGTVSTALGVAANSDLPTYLIVGDLSFIHDLNSLILAKMNQLDLFIIIINNDGGAIFSFLPQASAPGQFEKLFGTPHGIVFSGVIDMVDGKYRRAYTLIDIEEGIQHFQNQVGLRVLEVITDRTKSVSDRQGILDIIAGEIKKAEDIQQPKKSKLRYRIGH